MNQIGDKPEQVRKHREEERRRARGDDPAEPGGAKGRREHDPADRAATDEAARDSFDTYEEPEDRP
ncbi:hypothetical protein [Streptomyces sp. DH12]|uniref:hypothetical protein n=1 Tax=Streptomyces sp. DH12 TaxID=2857010 RepID=UPI001E5C8F97|nr:hypothetical protein [Streptomyces sp. DH12]